MDSQIRVFPDTNVFVAGLVSDWSASRAIIILARLRVFRLLLSPYVQSELEAVLLRRLMADYAAGGKLIESYQKMLELLDPELLPGLITDEIRQHRALIRHGSDVPVLVTAIKSKPDWLITTNIEHFTSEVAARSGLRIVTPHQFLRACTSVPHRLLNE
jgi:predicted nucleic acid-binding protein